MNKIKSAVAALATTLGLGIALADGITPKAPPTVVLEGMGGPMSVALPFMPMMGVTITRKGQYHAFRNIKKSARAAAKRAAVRHHKKYRA